MRLRRLLLVYVAIHAAGTATGAPSKPAEERASAIVVPYERYGDFAPRNEVDRIVLAGMKARGVEPARGCSDQVFLRRIYLDLTGSLPDLPQTQKFLGDKNPDKRAVLIGSLFDREEFADYWSLRWCDVLRVKAEFPINLWPNAVQAYHRWIRDAVRDNMPYDEFVRALLTSSGSNFRVPPVNFYRAIQGQEPSTIASAVALTFMGSRLDKWPEDRRAGMETLFSRVSYKKTSEWKEEIVFPNPEPFEARDVMLPDASMARMESGVDPREVFADWLIAPENRWFARNAVNRLWGWLVGRGIVEEVDDIRPDNPPSHPELLAYLERELVDSGYDLRHIMRLIVESSVYQQSSIPRSEPAAAEAAFACYPVRRLEAEVLADALCSITGTEEEYSSMIPEPFTFVPPTHRTIALSDGSITSSFLEMFGRPSRDTGFVSERNNQPNDAQRLHLLNSTHVQKKIESGWRLRRLLASAKGSPEKAARLAYLQILCRPPTAGEVETAKAYLKKGGSQQGLNDLVWALINSKEFLYRH